MSEKREMTLNEKLDLWVKITGVNPTEKQKSYTIYLDGRLSTYDIEKMNDRIKNSLEIDKSGVFAEAYLSIYLKNFIDNKKLSLYELLTNKEVSEYISDIKMLYDSLCESDAENKVVAEAKKAMDFYELPCGLDALSIMKIKSSAAYCMNGKLELRQFSKGNKKADSFKLSKDIYSFESLDAMILCSAKGNLNGVTLGYIKNITNLAESFFAFIIKNGDNLYILTDMPKHAHPAQSGMIRCPGRDMSARIESNYFPYETIANIDTSDLWGSSRYGVSEIKSETELSTVINEKIPYRVIGKIDNLAEEEALWFVLMAAYIKEKFYDNELPALDISYTRSMINSSLIEKNENALIVQKTLPNMELKEVTIDDTNNLEYERDNEGESAKLQNLINRYKDKVNYDLLNIISNTEKFSAIEDKYAKRNHWGEKLPFDYLSLNLDNEPGTKEEIEYKQKWIARYNFAKALKDIINEDYDQKCDNLYDTIKDYISSRLKELVIMHLKNELIGKKTQSKFFAVDYTDELEHISERYEFNKFYASYESFGKYRFGAGYNKSSCKCVFTNKAAGVVIKINPRNAEELAMVCGISVEELPIELQHYDSKSRPYYGNSILDNIDPFLWLIKDKFNEMIFATTILLSKKAYLDLCKEAGVEAVKFWENEKPVCFGSPDKNGTCSGSISRKWVRGHYEYNTAQKCLKCKWYKNKEDNSSE